MISVLCPVLNEEKYIENVLKHFINTLPKEKEIFIIDGGSTDRTLEIVRSWSEKYSNIFILHNSDKYVSFALNQGIKISKGDPIIRLDAHTVYDSNYYEEILKTFKHTGADIVGGPMRAIGNTSFQKVVAYCTSSVFGIGNSKIHSENFKGETDHVYLGSWRRNLFDDVGYFDEQLKRNQDDEFHYRSKSKGKIIFLNPEIISFYYPRSSIKSLINQYFQYGLYKPLVLWKVKSAVKVRHIIPSLFVLYLISLYFLYMPYYFAVLILYIIILFYFSIRCKLGIWEILLSVLVYPTLHVSYGLGFCLGFGYLFLKK